MSAPVVQTDGVVTSSLFEITTSGSVSISDGSCGVYDDGGVIYDAPRETLKNFAFIEAYAIEIFDISTHEMVGEESLISKFKIRRSADRKAATNPKGQELWSLYENIQFGFSYEESTFSLPTMVGNFGGMSEFATSSYAINRPVSEVKVIRDNIVTLKYTPVDPVDITINVVNDNDPVGKLYEYDVVATDNKFTVDGNVITFASGTTGMAMINYEKTMTSGSVLTIPSGVEYPIQEVHVYIKVEDVCTRETYSGVWVFYKAQRDGTSVDVEVTPEGKSKVTWTTIANNACGGKKAAKFFIDFDS